MKVSLSKLRNYTTEHGGYEILQLPDEIQLSFVPSFPEALEKSDSEIQPRVTMYGRLEGDIITFLKVEVDDSRGHRIKDMKDAEMTYKSWLEFVEDNY